jgi:hypothetical protein
MQSILGIASWITGHTGFRPGANSPRDTGLRAEPNPDHDDARLGTFLSAHVVVRLSVSFRRTAFRRGGAVLERPNRVIYIDSLAAAAGGAARFAGGSNLVRCPHVRL